MEGERMLASNTSWLRCSCAPLLEQPLAAHPSMMSVKELGAVRAGRIAQDFVTTWVVVSVLRDGVDLAA